MEEKLLTMMPPLILFTGQPGDIVVFHGHAFFDRLIQFGQRIHHPQLEAQWNHVGIVIDDVGTIIEARVGGVQLGNVYDQRGSEFFVISIPDDAQRAGILRFARSRLGRKYGYLEMVSLGLSIMFGFKFGFMRRGAYVCSGLAASCMMFVSIDMGDDDPLFVMPCQIAHWSCVRGEDGLPKPIPSLH